MPLPAEWWFSSLQVQQKVWPLTEGAGVTVAVLDTGVQASVPDLRGVVVPGGDVTGHHSNGETDFNPVGDGHGTMMSVLIAGQGLGTGMIGIAPKAKILPVVVNADASDVTSQPAAMAAGILYAANHGAQVISIAQLDPSGSTTGCDAQLQAAVAYAVSRNIVVVAPIASSNIIGNQPSQPGSCAGVLAVGAIGQDKAVWADSTPEPFTDLVAPGVNLISSGRDGKLVTNVTGTRSATALTAAAAALIRSRYPSMPWYQVVQRLTGTALAAGGRVPNESYGYGILRLSEAVNATSFPVSAGAPNPVYARYLTWLTTPQGRAVARQLGASASPTAAPSPSPSVSPKARARASTTAQPSTTMSPLRIVAISAVAGLVLLLGVGLIAWVTSLRRRARRPQPEFTTASARPMPDPGPAPDPGGHPPWDYPSPEFPAAEEPESDTGPYRVPPYSPQPEPPPDEKTYWAP